MKPPMPPELVALGDQLEAAAARALARRRTRRQLVLNAAASLVVVVPLTITLVTSQVTTVSQVPTAAPTFAPAAAKTTTLGDDPRVGDDSLSRDLRRTRLTPSSELLASPTLRPAPR